eukprot:CAMPEP_0169089182 /NCGR_PEP_ID=MMETSP1015-20121227/15146_1 /TAXON_ID=342587 /ORGANISM="Karlodinium micrum, Strain CCMP2283" /LENGTH=62 /DNA_ID=CAMNT_0009149497 /DNA_START=402 /DNA_END=587 /DNA_ORIENTATION=-
MSSTEPSPLPLITGDRERSFLAEALPPREAPLACFFGGMYLGRQLAFPLSIDWGRGIESLDE